jgi:HD-like signal output (HDOD) protein
MEKKSLTPSQLRLLAVEEELVDMGARNQFLHALPQIQEGSADGIGRILRSTIDAMPRIPVYAGTLFRAINSPTSTSTLISKAIGQDPSLAAQVLKYVNSPYYGFPNRIVDLQHAITLLGTKQIHSLILYHGMRTTLPNTRSFVNLQTRSVLLSHIAGAVAELVDPPRAPMLATLGLLSLIGNGVIFLAQHKHPEIEEVVGVLNHFKIGSMLLIRWNLPELIHETVRLMGPAKYVPPSEIPEAYRQNLSILTVAIGVLEQRSISRTDTSLHLQEYVSQAGFGSTPIATLAERQILPHMRTTREILPHVVRNFLDSSPHASVTIKERGIGALEKRALGKAIRNGWDRPAASGPFALPANEPLSQDSARQRRAGPLSTLLALLQRVWGFLRRRS